MPGDITEIGVQSIAFSAIKCAAQLPTMRTAECFCRLRSLGHDRAANANVSQTPATHTKRNCSFLHVTFRLSSQRCAADALRTLQLSAAILSNRRSARAGQTRGLRMLEQRGNTNCIRLHHHRMTSANVLHLITA